MKEGGFLVFIHMHTCMLCGRLLDGLDPPQLRRVK